MVEAKHLAVGFFTTFAAEDFRVFERWRIDRHEAVGSIDLFGRFNKSLAWDHDFGKEVAEAAERSGSDQV